MSQSSQTENTGSPNMDYEGKTISIITPPDKPVYYDALINSLSKDVNIDVNEIAWVDIDTITSLNNGKNEIVILPEAGTVPFGASKIIDDYLKNGGKLLTLGGPPFSQILYPSGNEWMTREQLAAGNEEQYLLFDFNKDNAAKGWTRGVYDSKNGYNIEISDSNNADGGKCLHVTLDNVVGWDVIRKNVKIPDEGYNTIGLWAKGDRNTSTLSIELTEKDNSRWYCSFPVTNEWQYIILTADDFNFWHDSQSAGRGDSNDKVSIGKVNSFSVGIAFNSVTPGENEYWISNICAIKMENLLTEPTLIIDGLSPEWKFYPITNGDKAVAFDNQVFVSDRDYVIPNQSSPSLFSLSPRPQGTGYNREKQLRFVPLIEVYDNKGLRSGFLAWMFVNSTSSGKGYKYDSSMIAGFGTSDPSFYNDDGIAAVVDVVRTMLNDTLFVEAGATEYIYVDSETKTLPLGAYIRGREADGLVLNIDLYKNGSMIFSKEYDISEINGKQSKNNLKIFNKSENVDLSDLSSGKPDTVTMTLIKDDKIIDRISHEIIFWSPKPENERKYITVADNEFIRDGKPLRLYGVNYMPSSGIGVNIENGQYFEHYVSSEAYDPDVFYKDLLRVKEVGFNSVSLFVYHQTAMQTKNMLHLIDMCDKLGLIVDLSIRPHADPFNLDEQEVIEMIQELHIVELDNIVAYDIAWERYFGTYDGSYGNPKGRKEYDEDWREWIVNNYGSLENAENKWGCDAVKTNEGAISPTDDMLRTDGNHNKMVAAYRRFVDDLVSQKHNYVKDLIKEYDPYHLVSARTGAQGGVPLADPGDMGYDYQALANGLDFMSPESYVINADFNTSDQGIFTNTYSRYVLPGAPVMWKEFGQHIWTGSNFEDNKQMQALQADMYTRIYDMMITGHTGAAYCWWWPGGYRVNENSDYGIINPDGSDRFVTGVIRANKEPFMNQPPFGEPDTFFEIDHDMSATGIMDIYKNLQDDFLSAVKSGKTVAFKDASTGTNTATVTDEAISGGVAGPENPAKFVNGEFRAVYIKFSDGSWRKVRYGGTVSLPAGNSIEIKVVMGNSLGAEWLSESVSDTAYVSLVSTSKSNITFDIPLKENVKYLDVLTQEFKLCDTFSEKTVVVFRFGIKGRFPFGSSFKFIINPT